VSVIPSAVIRKRKSTVVDTFAQEITIKESKPNSEFIGPLGSLTEKASSMRR
jgi:hypothetical protein